MQRILRFLVMGAVLALLSSAAVHAYAIFGGDTRVGWGALPFSLAIVAFFFPGVWASRRATRNAKGDFSTIERRVVPRWMLHSRRALGIYAVLFFVASAVSASEPEGIVLVTCASMFFHAQSVLMLYTASILWPLADRACPHGHPARSSATNVG